MNLFTHFKYWFKSLCNATQQKLSIWRTYICKIIRLVKVIGAACKHNWFNLIVSTICVTCLLQLFREVRIMKMLNHPNIGESRWYVSWHIIVTLWNPDLIGFSRSCSSATRCNTHIFNYPFSFAFIVILLTKTMRKIIVN